MTINEFVDLNMRRKKLLFSAIDNYIKQAVPITSILVQQTKMKEFSTATIRNELATLEAMGYLKQLHTSGGRIPTTSGYRFFVNEIIKNTTCSKEQLKNVKKELLNRTGNLNEIVKTIADTITKTTNYPAVVILDGFDKLLLKSVNLMQLVSGQMIILIDTNAGVITNTVQLKNQVTKQDLQNASKLITDCFFDKTLGYLMKNIKTFSNKISKSMKIYQEIFNLIIYVLKNYSNNDSTSQGLIKLLNNPEYGDVEKAKSVFDVLNDKKKLKDMFGTAEEEGVIIKIGDENQLDELSSCAIIKTPITLDGNKVASIGIIGPKRIDYATIAGILKIIADEIKKR